MTEADLASQEAIFATIRKSFPTHRLLGEESDTTERIGDSQDSEFKWIVDPLDGTTNYVHGLENYSVSIALQKGNQIIEAAVLDPVRDHCYRATVGEGAFLNDKPLHVSDVSALNQALVAASFSSSVDAQSLEIQRFIEVLVRCQAIRRLGSAALNLCYVAAGKLDGYWATSLKAWDVAAGYLIVREAGGTIRGIGDTFDLDRPKLVATSTDQLATEMTEVFSRVKPN